MSPKYLAQGLAHDCHPIKLLIEFLHFIKTSWHDCRKHEKLEWSCSLGACASRVQCHTGGSHGYLPDHCLHSADQLLRPTLPGVDGGWRGLVEVSFCGGPHLITVVVRVAPFAVPNRPVSVATAAPCGKAGDHCPSDMGAAVLQAEKAKPIKAGF